jgi:hypothetical protein
MQIHAIFEHFEVSNNTSQLTVFSFFHFPGPSEVILFGYEAYAKVHGPESKCGRSAHYDILHPMVSLDITRDPAIHTYRRKRWDQAFSIKGKSDFTFCPRF